MGGIDRSTRVPRVNEILGDAYRSATDPVRMAYLGIVAQVMIARSHETLAKELAVTNEHLRTLRICACLMTLVSLGTVLTVAGYALWWACHCFYGG